MAKAIFSVLLKFIKSIADLILAPINFLVVNLLPDLSSLISTFNSAVERFLGTNLAFFAHMLPPITKSLILLYLGFLITYYTIVLSAHAILKVINIIKAIKIW